MVQNRTIFIFLFFLRFFIHVFCNLCYFYILSFFILVQRKSYQTSNNISPIIFQRMHSICLHLSTKSKNPLWSDKHLTEEMNTDLVSWQLYVVPNHVWKDRPYAERQPEISSWDEIVLPARRLHSNPFTTILVQSFISE